MQSLALVKVKTDITIRILPSSLVGFCVVAEEDRLDELYVFDVQHLTVDGS